jgi:hypothetical protein
LSRYGCSYAYPYQGHKQGFHCSSFAVQTCL